MMIKIDSRYTNFLSPNPLHLRCPSCRKEGVFNGILGQDFQWGSHPSLEAYYEVVGIRKCPNSSCNCVVFVVYNQHGVIISYPPQVIDFDSINLPKAILASFEEAILCHSQGCYRASALMVRRVLEELCQDKGAQGKDLKARIKALASTIIIPSDLIEAADELRLLGNDAAHIESKSYDAIEKEELDIAIEMTKELLKAVYQLTSLVDRMRALKKPPPSLD